MIHDPFRMEFLLRLWEDTWQTAEDLGRILSFLRKRGQKAGVSGGQVAESMYLLASLSNEMHWKSFRNTLSGPKSLDRGMLPIDLEFLTGNKRLPELINLDQIALDLQRWALSSKRVFSLSEDLQLLLEATSTGKMTWSEVKFPFPCFALALTEVIEYKGRVFDFLVFRFSEGSGDGLIFPDMHVDLIPQTLGAYQALSKKECKEIKVLIEKGQIDQAMELQVIRVKKIFPYMPQGFAVSNFMDKPIDNSGGILKPSPEELIMTRVMRIIAGLCLYLKTLPADSNHLRPEHSPVPSEAERGSSVVRGQHRLVVTTEIVLSDRDRELLRDPTNEAEESLGEKGVITRSHYRRGFWRRPRGKGDDPYCPKTEWVRPTIVCRELGLPRSGSQTTIR